MYFLRFKQKYEPYTMVHALNYMKSAQQEMRILYLQVRFFET